MKTQQEDSHLQAKERGQSGHKPEGTLTEDCQPPRPGRKKLPLSGPLRLCTWFRQREQTHATGLADSRPWASAQGQLGRQTWVGGVLPSCANKRAERAGWSRSGSPGPQGDFLTPWTCRNVALHSRRTGDLCPPFPGAPPPPKMPWNTRQGIHGCPHLLFPGQHQPEGDPLHTKDATRRSCNPALGYLAILKDPAARAEDTGPSGQSTGPCPPSSPAAPWPPGGTAQDWGQCWVVVVHVIMLEKIHVPAALGNASAYYTAHQV